MSNKARLQDGTYRGIRVRYGIPARMTRSIPRHVGATCKGVWTELRKNAEARQACHTKKGYRGLDAAFSRGVHLTHRTNERFIHHRRRRMSPKWVGMHTSEASQTQGNVC